MKELTFLIVVILHVVVGNYLPYQNFVSCAREDGKIRDIMQSSSQPLEVLCEINGFLIPSVVDTGAEISVMSESCARRCRIAEGIDSRYNGLVVGVGSSNILGQIDDLPLRVGPIIYRTKIIIIESLGTRMDFIIGLDFLRKFRCDINIRDNILRLHAKGRSFRIPFITNSESRYQDHYSPESFIEIHEDEKKAMNTPINKSPINQSNDSILNHKNKKRETNVEIDSEYDDDQSGYESNYDIQEENTALDFDSSISLEGF